ncbi:hypothetical protein [Succinimonas sp.]|uniref:hypothetical protein n=1 Tax=Succinimonas sp. TaxID=1936151 RepID=UPI003863125E
MLPSRLNGLMNPAKSVTKFIIWERYEGLFFKPNAVFRLKPASEIRKYIFPAGWDISAISGLLAANGQEEIQQEKAGEQEMPTRDSSSLLKSDDDRILDAQDKSNSKDCSPKTGSLQMASDAKYCCSAAHQYNHRLYGSFWLLEQIARREGVFADLMTVFNDDVFKVNEVLSLALFPYLSGKSFSRFAKWQRTHKTLPDCELTPPGIAKLLASITDVDLMNFIRLRLERLTGKPVADCDSGAPVTVPLETALCQAYILRRQNRGNPELQNAAETAVYVWRWHQPVYSRTFPGNTSDMAVIRAVTADLKDLGIPAVTFMTDRGYASVESIAAFITAKIPFLMPAETSAEPVLPLLYDIEFDKNGLPLRMDYDLQRKLYHKKADVPARTGRLPHGNPGETASLKACIFINPMRRSAELAELQQMIMEEKASLDADIKAGVIPDDLRRYNALYEYFRVTGVADETGNVTAISYTENTEKIKREEALRGVFAFLMSGIDLSAMVALEQYRNRAEDSDIIPEIETERRWQGHPSFDDDRCGYGRCSDGQSGFSIISLAGLIAFSRLRNAWRESMKDKYSSALEMLDEMESIRFSEYADGSCRMSAFSSKQTEICRACGIEPPEECLPFSLRQTIGLQIFSVNYTQKTENSLNP